MKRLLSLFLSCIFVVGLCFSAPVTASAAGEVLQQEEWKFVIDEEELTAEITSYSGVTATEVEIPVSFTVDEAEYAVTSIASGAFSACDSLAQISVAAGNTYFESNDGVLIEIGAEKGISVYPDAKSGESYLIPADVTYIKEGAFDSCEELKYLFFEGASLELNGNDTALTDVVIHYSATDHTYSSEFEVDVEATCKAAGSKSKHCTVEGCAAKTEVTELPVQADAHDAGRWEEKTAPTCYSEGVMVKICTLCETELATEAIPRNDHSFGKWQIKTAPTCNADGEMVRKCTATGCTEEETMPLTADVDHISGEWETVEAASCDTEGIRIKKCTVCGEECEREVIPAQHSFGEWEIVDEATCKEVGSKERTCSSCGEKETEEIEKLSHTPGSWVLRKASTCAEEGEYVRLCSKCDEVVETAAVKKEDHDFGDWVIKTEPTCTEVGIKERICGNCSETETEEIPVLDHDFEEEFTVDTEATCEADGSKSKHCSRCEEKTDVTVIPSLGHDFEEEFTVDVEATCTEAGSKSKHCTRCEEKTDVTVIPSLGHDFEEEFTVDTEATCTEAGSESRHCSRCEEKTDSKEIPATGHVDIELILIKEETCLESGEYLKKCKCGEELGKVTTDPRGHTYNEWIIEEEATCFEDGSKYRVCSACEDKEIVVIEKIDHKNSRVVRAAEATCLEDGYSGDTYCPDCDEILEEGKVIKALGHKAGEWETDKEATFTETGTQHKDCIRCGIELEKAIIDKIKLKTPTVKIENTTKGIKVSWDKDEHAKTYNIYKKIYKDGKWSGWKCVKTVNAKTLSWEDTDVEVSSNYKYTVRALNGKFKGGVKDSNALLHIKAPKVTIAVSDTGISVKWAKVDASKNYVVYRSEYVGGKWSSWKTLKTVKGTVLSYSDKKIKSGVKYRYTVRAVNGDSRSAYTASNTLFFLARPTLEISNGAVGMVGVWTQVDGAKGYTIYRSEYNAKTKAWTKWINLGTAKSTSKTFTDKTVKEGIKYKYTVKAINGKSASAYIASNDVIYIAQPMLKITLVETGITGTWSKVKGAEGYIVYRSEMVKGKWTKWRNLGTAGPSAKSFTDKTVKSGVTYRYTIRAKVAEYKSSYVASNELTFLSVPVVKAANAAKGVMVSWGAVDGAEKYIVYRSQLNSKGKWTKWATLSSVTEEKYVDATAKNNVQYKYTVKAVAGDAKSLYKESGAILFVSTPKVQIEEVATGVKVNWTVIDDATGYTIYRAEKDEDGKWTKWESMGTANANKKAWIDKSVKDGVTYKYMVRALNGKSKSSYVSSNAITTKEATEDTMKDA